MVTVVILDINSNIDGLMWLDFEQKCVKFTHFFFLNFTPHPYQINTLC